MFLKKTGNKEKTPSSGLRLLRLTAWGILAGLWIFILVMIANYWFVEVPRTKALYEAGLEQGFDALAGIVAASDPTWQNTRSVAGRPVGHRLNRLHGDTMFDVWLEMDEAPGWNSGLASLRFDGQGRLVWARRYFESVPPVAAVNPNTGGSFPVIKPRLDLRKPAKAHP